MKGFDTNRKINSRCNASSKKAILQYSMECLVKMHNSVTRNFSFVTFAKQRKIYFGGGNSFIHFDSFPSIFHY